MNSGRVSLINVLKIQFKDEETKKICLESSAKNIKANRADRAFDDFPTLLSEDELNFFVDKFKKILESITDFNKENFTLIPRDQKSIRELEDIIIKKGCEEILNKNGSLKCELVQLLNWQQFQKNISNRKIICAYVGAVNHHIMFKLQDLIKEKLDAHGAMSTFINDFCPIRVKQEMNRLNYPKNLAIAATAFGLFGFAGLAAYGLYYSLTNSENVGHYEPNHFAKPTSNLKLH